MAWTVRMRLVSAVVTFTLLLLEYGLLATTAGVLLWAFGAASVETLLRWGVGVGLVYCGAVVVWTHVRPPAAPGNGRVG